MVTNFEELCLRVDNEDARSMIREGIRCYEIGAYRSAIVSAYVAVSSDLVYKLRSLAIHGDAAAKEEVGKLDDILIRLRQGDESAFRNLLSFERELIDIFRDKFEFFDIYQYDDMVRLKDDRNKCAHPSMTPEGQHFRPSAELARFHLRSALVHVLSQSPRQGKAASESILSLILSPTFPEFEVEAEKRLRSSAFANARPALIRRIVDDLCFGWGDLRPWTSSGVW